MKLLTRLLSLMLIVCLLPLAALATDTGTYRLLDVPETSKEKSVTIPFEGELGVSYTLHYRYRNIWLLPTTTTLTTGNKGEFVVELGEGQNDFVLAEEGQPRDAEGVVPFSIAYVPSGVTLAPAVAESATPLPTPEVTATPEVSATPEAAETTAAPATEAPTAEPTPEPSPEPTTEPTAEPTPEPTPEPVPGERNISLWMKGNDVLALQEGLTALKMRYGKADGVYGPRTRAAVMRYQRKHGIKVDGIVGVQTRERLAAEGVEIPLYEAPDMTRPAGFDRDLSNGKIGMDVYALQEALRALGYLDREPDQVYGKHTRSAVRAFQRDNGLKVDGIAGPETLRLLIDGNPAAKAEETPAEPQPEETAAATLAPAETVEPEETVVPEATAAPTLEPTPEPAPTGGNG